MEVFQVQLWETDLSWFAARPDGSVVPVLPIQLNNGEDLVEEESYV